MHTDHLDSTTNVTEMFMSFGYIWRQVDNINEINFYFVPFLSSIVYINKYQANLMNTHFENAI